jgi:ribonuclease HI/endonuclease/exonuclease/phosphatase family metal-dependent hydrolase
MSKDLHIIHLNVNKNRFATESILNTAIDMGADIVCIQEPWLVNTTDADGDIDYSNSRSINHTAYQQLGTHNPLDKRQRPMVLTYFSRKAHLNYTLLPQLAQDTHYQAICVKYESQELYIFNIYNQKRVCGNIQTNTFKHFIEPHTYMHSTIFLGDFNAHHHTWEPARETDDRDGQQIAEWIDAQDIVLHNDIEESTFWRPNMARGSTIDLTLTTRHLANKIQDWQVVIDGSISDHTAIFFTVAGRTSLSDKITTNITKLNTKKADWEEFAKILKRNLGGLRRTYSDDIEVLKQTEINIQHLKEIAPNTKDKLEKLAENFSQAVYDAASKSIPKVTMHSKAKPWWNEELNDKRKVLNKAWTQLKLAMKEGRETINNKRLFLIARHGYQKAIKTAKIDHWNSFLAREDPQSIFKAMGYTKDGQPNRIPQIRDSGGNLQETFEGRCDAFKTAFYPPPPIAPEPQWSTYRRGDWEWPKLEMIELQTVCHAVSRCTAPGPDDIDWTVLNRALEAAPDDFLEIYGIFMSIGYQPKIWKQATGIILRKPGKPDYTMPKAYRVISLLNCMGKIMERTVAYRLLYLAETTSLLHKSQLGGRRKKSAIDATVLLTDMIQQEKKAGRKVTTVFMDVKGAFDFVAKNQLLQILYSLGMPIEFITWVRSFLEERLLKLSFNEEMEEFKETITGIPQGSPVSPILFLIYIRDLFKDKAVYYLSYMDDLSLSKASTSWKKNIKELAKVVKDMVTLAASKAIQFDLDKTDLMHWGTSKINALPSLELPNGEIKKPQQSLRWLGIIFDPHLKFRIHINTRVAQATRAFHRLMRLGNSERGLSAIAVRQLYCACVTSIADYGVEVYWKGQQFVLKALQTLQNLGVRRILGAFKTSPIVPMEIEAALPPPKIRLNQKRWAYAKRIHKLAPIHPINEAIQQNKARRKELLIEKPTQLEYIEEICDEWFPPSIEKISHFHFKPWNSGLPYTTHISKLSKEDATAEHIARRDNDVLQNKTYIYTDASSMEESTGIGVGLAVYEMRDFTPNLIYTEKKNIGKEQLVYNGELEGIVRACEYAAEIAIPEQTFKICADNQASLHRLARPSDNPGQEWQLRAILAAEEVKDKNANIELHWVPGHTDIEGNEKADMEAKLASTGATNGNTTSYAMVGVKMNSKLRQQHLSAIAAAKRKMVAANANTYLNKYPPKIRKQVVMPKNTPRAVSSAYYQLKLQHGRFNGYIYRRSNYSSDKNCPCGNAKQTPRHLLLECKQYKQVRKEVLRKESPKDLTMQYLLHSRPGIAKTIEYIQRTGIATKVWMESQEKSNVSLE